ncbi:MAG: ferrous iron transport protein B [Peptococcaceae bacterium]|nr:ferrous iron transport protein B [Peptococcaceae bacterium]
MNCKEFKNKAGVGSEAKCILLAGNPNVGKTALFNGLTGLFADVSNFPGTTVDTCYSCLDKDILIDTPGVYGVSSFSSEESLVRDLILSADLVINVVDMSNLERDLFLTLHIIDLGIPMIVALNMEDEIERYGLRADADKLEEILGVPVVATSAVDKKGLDILISRLPEAKKGIRDIVFAKKLNKMAQELGSSEASALLLLEGDITTSKELGLSPGNDRMSLYKKRRDRVNEIVPLIYEKYSLKTSFLDRLGNIMIRPATGFPIMILVLFLVYLAVGVFFAQVVVGFIENTIMQGYFQPFVRSTLSVYFKPGSLVYEVLAGQFGLVTMTITYVVGLLTPLVAGFFLVLSFLEDTGYLSRVATLMDRMLSIIGLNGLSVIPLVLGFGCVTAAIITTRILPSDRERRIAIFVLSLAVPCSAQLAMVAAIMAGQGGIFFALYALVVIVVLAMAGIVLSKILPGFSTPLLMEIPPLRFPKMSNVLIKTGIRSWHFLKEAFPLFLVGTLVLSLLKINGILDLLENYLEPVTVGWLNLPKESASAFIMGFIRREFGPAGILDFPMTNVQVFVMMITLTLFVPCIASVMVIFKERGWREGLFIWISVFILSFLIGGLISNLLMLLDFWVGGYSLMLMIFILLLVLCFLIVFGRRKARPFNYRNNKSLHKE